MREIFKAQVKEFFDAAYAEIYCMGEDGSGPSPMQGDRFFITDDDINHASLIMYSFREEEFNLWDKDWWVRLDTVPPTIKQMMESK